MRVCPSCKFENTDDAVFCEECGKKLDDGAAQGEMTQKAKRICPACKFENTEDAVFCEECGRRLDDAAAQADVIICSACAAQNKKSARFCVNCGAELNVPPAIHEEVQIEDHTKQKQRSKLNKFIIAEVLGIAVVVALFFGLGHMKYGAESIAEKYIQAYASQDWHTMYALLDLPEGSFMKESQFRELMEKEDAPQLSNYKIQSKSEQQSSIMQEFQIEYSASGEDMSTMDLTMVCDGEKELFFFDKWRVSSSEVLAKNYPIWVPSGAEVTCDGIELKEPSDSGDGMDCYTVSIFKGIHELSVAMPWSEIYNEQIDTRATTSATIDISEMKLTQDGEKALKAKAQQDLQKWFSCGMAGEDYAAVEDLFAEDVRDDYEATYHKLVVALKKDPASDYNVNGLDFYNFDFDLGTDTDENVRTVKVNYEYKTDYTYKGERNTTSTSTDAVMDVSYMCENGTWKIHSLVVE